MRGTKYKYITHFKGVATLKNCVCIDNYMRMSLFTGFNYTFLNSSTKNRIFQICDFWLMTNTMPILKILPDDVSGAIIIMGFPVFFTFYAIGT